MMNKKLPYLMGFLSIFFLLWGCGSTRTAAEKEMFALALRKSLEQPYFRFEATHVYPMGFRPIYLTPHYDVEVSADTLKVYLPYYGRAYRAPMDPREGGFNFISTKFTYRYGPGNRKGNWFAHFSIQDLDRPVTLIFDIWENGSTGLIVNDFNRQSISFQGETSSRATIE